MNKLKFYLMNGFFSAVIGAVVEVAALLFHKQSVITLYSLTKSMGIGIFIGTVSMFFILQVFLRLKQWPSLGFLSNFTVIALLTVADGVLNGVRTLPQYVHSRSLLVLIVAESFGFIVTYFWYRRMMVYSEKLHLKQESLRDLS